MSLNAKPYVVMLTAFGLVLAACSSDVSTIAGSGERVSRTFDLEAFSEIDASNAFRVEVEVDSGASQSVVVEIDDNLADRLDVRVDGQRLHVGLDDDVRVRLDDPPTAAITVNELSWLGASGASAVSVQGVAAAAFDLRASGASTIELFGTVDALVGDLSGASKLEVADIGGGDVELGLSGASGGALSGEASRLSLDVSGASRVDTRDLTALDAVIEASGASEVKVFASGSVQADASGASNVTVAGDAELDANTSGSSTVERG